MARESPFAGSLPRRARCLFAGAAVALLLTASGASAASPQTFIRGTGHLLYLKLALDENGVPVQWIVDSGHTRCRNSWIPWRPRTFTNLDSATPDSFEHRASFSERNSGFTVKGKVHITGRRVGEKHWEGRFETTLRVFYMGSRINTCSRDGRERAWKAHPGIPVPGL